MDLGRLTQTVLRAGQAQQQAQGRFGDPQGAWFVALADRVGQRRVVLPGGRGDQVDTGAAPVVREARGVLQLAERQMGLECAQIGAVDVECGDLVLAGR